MQDPIADMLTRIRNAQSAFHEKVTLASSKLKLEIVKVLKNEGYIADFIVNDLENNTKTLTVYLKYFKGQPVIQRLERVSRPGLRIYKAYKSLVAVPGFGVSVLSTTRGIMTHVEAKLKGIGGELLCIVA